ncbi:MAG: alanine--tRNA ligase [Flavobacteriales bacterium]|nr:alanine--tRNA ligase [Flavobacteriales bacterium]
MKKNSAEIRKSFITFFKEKEHKIVKSVPMVIKGDPTLMFTNAGMNQFKDIFLGNSEIKDDKVANSQKCLRVSGKHNDLEEVGHDTYHHTMFEMLGNWSFGDYFKKDAIDWAWEYLIDVCNLDKDRIYVTVFEGDKNDGLEKDMESYNLWKKHLPEDRVLNGNKKDNFWEMGETGPCGPCSEIHFDNRSEEERKSVDGKTLVNEDHPEVIEIWNLVFMQYNRKSDSSLELLPNKHVDTGMGFERLCMIMQDVKSNYDTDVFTPIISEIEKLSDKKYGEDEKVDIAMRVISDHIRAIAFSIADGQLPSNVKAGYVIRRILRRAVRYGYTFLDMKDAFIYKLVEVLCNQMGDAFEELVSQKELISKVIQEEENSFLRTLSDGLKRLDVIISNSEKIVSGELVFELYDTFGFPLDLTSLILSENNLELDVEAFNSEMQKQKNRSRNASKSETTDWKVLIEDDKEEFIGYKSLETEVKITKYRQIKTQDNTLYQIVFNLTPFYPEGGGQVGDIGTLYSDSETIEIIDTKKENNLIIHFSEKLPTDLDSKFIAKVDKKKRISSARNHTATHLLHEVLREELGDHVQQKGSLVCPDYLRFDFTHFSALTKEELSIIEKKVNDKIAENISLEEHNNIPLSEAEKMGAMMLFGEKYGDTVRAIQFNKSIELCGGTHVNTTSNILSFKIKSESSTAAGIRRIEAITADALNEYHIQLEDKFSQISSKIKNKDVVKGVEDLLKENKNLQKKIESYRSLEVNILETDLQKNLKEINGINFIIKDVSVDAESMKAVALKLRTFKEKVAVLLISEQNNKLLLTVSISDDLVANGLNAGNIIRDVSKEVKGGGGGQSFIATAGGSDVRLKDKAIDTFIKSF